MIRKVKKKTIERVAQNIEKYSNISPENKEKRKFRLPNIQICFGIRDDQLLKPTQAVTFMNRSMYIG